MIYPTNCKRIAMVLLPTHIGGPGTLLPPLLESFLSWVFATSCLSVALWHYQVERYRTRIASAYKQQAHRRKQRLLLPLTTHSRREWVTVSDYQGLRNRYKQFLQIIYTTVILPPKLKVPNEEKKDDKEEDSLDEYVVVDEKTCREKQYQEHEEHPSSVGQVVAKWLTASLVVSQMDPISPPMPQLERNNKPDSHKRKLDDESDSLYCHDSLEMLIRLVRTNEAARRLASLLLGEDPVDGDITAISSTESGVADAATTKIKNGGSKEKWLGRLSSEEAGAGAVIQALRKIWPRLLELPAQENHSNSNAENITISIIVPSFREEGEKLAAKLQASLEHAIEPHRIEIIVVHVVERYQNQKTEYKRPCDNLSPFAKALRDQFEPTVEDRRKNEATVSRSPKLRILEYHGGGGRGPCLNYGANHANGSIVTFLHADTRLATYGWDKAISSALEENGSGRPRTTCCAFSFAIDTSPEALTVRWKDANDCGKDESLVCSKESNHNQLYHPPGLRAIEVTANLRCKFFSLPYGDQCLSLPTDVFRYIGGYPDQCLMEDYEVIRLLRMRSAASLGWSSSRSLDPYSGQRQEIIEILSDYKAICSPRRWQHYGVLYVTYTNSYCVKLYNNGNLTPDELFCRYYKTATPPNRMNGEMSSWERGLQL